MAKPLIVRRGLIIWMYGVAVGHLLAGLLLSWLATSPWFDFYHHSLLAQFWPADVPPEALQLQLFWLQLFGATLQNLAVFMGILIYVGNHLRSRLVWGGLIGGILIWAPQDILLSWQANVTLHVWLDIAALVAMLPPLLCLWLQDKKTI